MLLLLAELQTLWFKDWFPVWETNFEGCGVWNLFLAFVAILFIRSTLPLMVVSILWFSGMCKNSVKSCEKTTTYYSYFSFITNQVKDDESSDQKIKKNEYVSLTKLTCFTSSYLEKSQIYVDNIQNKCVSLLLNLHINFNMGGMRSLWNKWKMNEWIS